MANVPEIIVDGYVAQLTRAIASGISGSIPRGLVNHVVSRDVVESFRRDMGGDVVSGSVSDSLSQGVGSHVMVNGFAESGMGNGVNEYFSFGRHLDRLHVTWAHLEKKRTRLQANTKTLEDLCSQSLETASQTIHDAVTTHPVTTSHISRRCQPAPTQMQI
ncbi:hypothetical protein Tco_1048204 [Tanacetum coccineum]